MATDRSKREEVIPSAARLMTSLRDLGYDFTNAVADLIDNSLAAKATRVEVMIHFDGPDSWVRISDNGTGMNGTEISEAMRLGSATRAYAQDDLGKFGLGLKTASLSQARCITVASRTSMSRKQIECRRLDLDDVEQRDRWEIEHPAAATRPTEVVEPLQDGTGTVVLWTKLDRILNRSDPFGGWAHRHLLNLAERLDAHLGMVFGRFLTGKAKRSKKIQITINGTRVEPWDPFCLTEHTEQLTQKELPVGDSFVGWRPYVLPPQRDFSSDEAWRAASGPNQWNRQQGLYVYRADRMIQSGGWSYLRSQDEHTKLARVALEFWPDLDESFEINISKMRVRLPDELRDQLKSLVSFVSQRANDRYRISNRRDAPPPRPPSQRSGYGTPITDDDTLFPPPAEPDERSRGAGTVKRNEPSSGGNGRGDASTNVPAEPSRPHISSGEVIDAAASRIGLAKEMKRIRREVKASNPEVADELGW